jgi:hypothetical protein
MIFAVISEYLGNVSSVKPLRLPSLNIPKKCDIHLTSMILVLLTALTASVFHILQHTSIIHDQLLAVNDVRSRNPVALWSLQTV